MRLAGRLHDTRLLPAARAALVVLAAVVVSAGSLRHGFVFDDHMLVGGNAPVIRGEAPITSAFTYRYWGAADEASPNELYRPVTIMSLGLNARCLGPGPLGMHAGNVALHAANALLVLLLVGRLFHRPRVALAAALLFAVHPVATEAVIPVAGRADLLAAFFLLVSCVLALAASRRRGPWTLIGGLGMAFATFLAALSKEHAFIAPLLTIGLLGADRRRHSADARSDRHYLVTGATLTGLQVFVLVMALLLRAQILGYVFQSAPPASPSTSYLAFVNNPIQFAEPLPRVLTALRVAVMGAGLMAFPAEMSADYSYDQIPVTGLPPGAADYGAVAFAALYLGLLAWSARRFPVTMFALIWSALTYLLASNLLFPIGTIFGERLLYLPLAGFALLVAAGWDRLYAQGARLRRVSVVLLLTLLALYAGRSVVRARDWSSDETLFAATVKASPRSAKAHSNQGFILQRQGRYEEAAASFRQALAIAPGLTGSGVSMARCLMEMGRPAEAIEQYERVIARDDGISVAWSGLGVAQAMVGRLEDAEASLRLSLGLSLGGNREAVIGLADVLARTGREEAAIALLERAAAALPQAAEIRSALGQAHAMLGLRLLKEGNREAFLEQMLLTVKNDPDNGPARYNLALDALQRGDTVSAREHARAGLRSGYDFPAGFLETLGIDRSREKKQEPGPPGS
ncbi:MAG: tetratricopeptide repeat protein [Candidatus Polarisedimenticolia bacterium]